MLEARFADGGSFKKLVEALRDYKEINLECDENGIHLKVMDECHVSLADLRLHHSIFQHYFCDKSYTLGLNVESLARLIRSAPSDVPFVLKKQDDYETLKLESDEDVSSETLTIPEQTYQVEIDMPTKVYAAIFKDISGAAEDVMITVTSTTIKFDADGEKGRIENTFYRGQGVFATSNWIFDSSQSTTALKQTFAVRFLSGFTKACSISDTVTRLPAKSALLLQVTLSMSAGVPMKLEFPLGDASFLAFYVAPAFQ